MYCEIFFSDDDVELYLAELYLLDETITDDEIQF